MRQPGEWQRGEGRGARPPGWAVLVALAALVAGVYGQTAGFGYVFDDEFFILGSPEVREGLSANAVRWAFESAGYGNWFPLTRLSWLADVELFGLRPGPSHVVNALLHLAGAWGAFLVMASATGRRRASAVLAALWAAHPLQVESVAWISERSMLLSAVLLWATLGAYLGYVRRPGAWRYLLVALGALLSFLAKPITVTLPALLLLLDWWPLGRLRAGAEGGGRRLPVIEKVPLAVLAAAFGVKAIMMQLSIGSMTPLEVLSAAGRLGVATRATAWYVLKAVWPTGLCIYYPLAKVPPPWWRTAAAVLLLAAISAAAVRARRTHPQALAGWLWFAFTLLPVSGLLQAGAQATADRYAYLPLAGLLVAAAALGGRTAAGAARMSLAGAALALVLAAASFSQTRHWRDETTVFVRAISVEGGESWVARFHLGEASEKAGDLDAAIRHHQRGLLAEPRISLTHRSLGDLWARKGDLAAAERHLREALRIEPKDAAAQESLEDVLRCAARPTPAGACFEEARRARADTASERSLRRGQMQDGIRSGEMRRAGARRSESGGFQRRR